MKTLTETILDSQKLLALKHNWDDEGALPINKNNYDRAMSFLYELNKFVGDSLMDFSINPLSCGGVDISWNYNDLGIVCLVAFKNRTTNDWTLKEEYSMSWYGWNQITDSEINDTTRDVKNMILFCWIKQNLTI